MKQNQCFTLLGMVMLLCAAGCGKKEEEVREFKRAVVRADADIRTAAIRCGKALQPFEKGADGDVEEVKKSYAALQQALKDGEDAMARVKVPPSKTAQDLHEGFKTYVRTVKESLEKNAGPTVRDIEAKKSDPLMVMATLAWLEKDFQTARKPVVEAAEAFDKEYEAILKEK